MFRPILISIAIITFASTALAVGPLGGLGLGAKAGMNYSDIESDRIDSQSRLGFVGGLYVTVPMGKSKLQPELLYSMRGYKFDDGDVTVKLDYVEVPVLIRRDLSPVTGTGLYLYAGPVFSFLAQAKSGGDDFDEMCQSTVTSLAVGAGGSIGRVLNLDGRFVYGITDVFDTGHAQVSDGDRHLGFALMAVYSLGL